MSLPAIIVEYHDRTKHHPNRYARSLGYMDWSTQPDPFRHFEGARRIELQHPPVDERISYDSLFRAGARKSAPPGLASISRLFYDSMAISAWKQAPGTSPWSLRINPSSGCLHPTESYLIAGSIDGLNDRPAVYHYSPYFHALERRIEFESEPWQQIADQLPHHALLVAFTSIYWRESWKYGERAFRYCHHDVGHAIGAVALSAAALGWQTRLIDTISDEQLATLLGVHLQRGSEAEHPDCLVTVYPNTDDPGGEDPGDKDPRGEDPGDEGADEFAAATLEIPAAFVEQLMTADFSGRPNQLSREHHPWPVIDEVSLATRRCTGYESQGSPPERPERTTSASARRGQAYWTSQLRQDADNRFVEDRAVAAQTIIRQRRSAVSMDGLTAIDREQFYGMLRRCLPGQFPFDAFPWPVGISLALMLHRVNGLESGLYLLVRHASHFDDLRENLSSEFAWQRPPDCPEDLPFFLLRAADCRDTAKLVCCHQEIAADGAFSLGMLSQFETALKRDGPSIYPRLFWETGLIGQLLYLEAEAAGIRATGIGCFFDDVMHELLGIRGHAWQSLYHFTVGGERSDLRIQSTPPYIHLSG